MKSEATFLERLSYMPSKWQFEIFSSDRRWLIFPTSKPLKLIFFVSFFNGNDAELEIKTLFLTDYINAFAFLIFQKLKRCSKKYFASFI